MADDERREAERRSNWTQADQIDLETIRLIALLQREMYEHTGAWPTATALRAALRQPSH